MDLGAAQPPVTAPTQGAAKTAQMPAHSFDSRPKPARRSPAAEAKASSDPAVPFVEQFATPDQVVQAPAADQERTVAVKDAAEALNPAEQILEWSVEQYAQLCAEIADNPKESDAVWTRHGIKSARVRTFATNVWRKRLADDPELGRSWSELVKGFRQK